MHAEYISIKGPDFGATVKYCVSLYTLQHCKNLPALLILVSISLLQSPVVVTLLPRYVNFSTSSIGLLSISTGLLLVVFTHKTCLFGVDLQFNFVSCYAEKLCPELCLIRGQGHQHNPGPLGLRSVSIAITVFCLL